MDNINGDIKYNRRNYKRNNRIYNKYVKDNLRLIIMDKINGDIRDNRRNDKRNNRIYNRDVKDNLENNRIYDKRNTRYIFLITLSDAVYCLAAL